jgi:hypothetical protein
MLYRPGLDGAILNNWSPEHFCGNIDENHNELMA